MTARELLRRTALCLNYQDLLPEELRRIPELLRILRDIAADAQAVSWNPEGSMVREKGLACLPASIGRLDREIP